MEATIMAVVGIFILVLIVFHLKEKSSIFGVVTGIMMIVFGLFLLSDGIEFKSGVIVFDQNDTIVYQYTNLKDTDNALNTVICSTLLLVGIYVMFNSGFNLAGVRQKS